MNVLYVRDTKVQAMDPLLNAARQFAQRLLRKWNMGRCQEDVIVLYARDNNIVILFLYHSLHTLTFVKLFCIFKQDCSWLLDYKKDFGRIAQTILKSALN